MESAEVGGFQKFLARLAAVLMDGEWVSLLRTPEKAVKLPPAGGHRPIPVVRVLENTPQRWVGVKKGKRSEVQLLRTQVAALVKEKKELALSVSRSRNNPTSELSVLYKTIM